MRARWTPAALRHLEDIERFIARDQPQAALAVIRRIEHSAQLLLEFPYSGKPGVRLNTRERAVPATPFVLIYRVQRGEVVFVAVAHSASKQMRDLLL